MTREADVARLVETAETERDIRIAIWNGLRNCGVSQDFAQIYIRNIMGEACMVRALAALSAEPAAGEVERILRETISLERELAAKRDIGKKAAACHSYAAFALEAARDKIRALSHATPTADPDHIGGAFVPGPDAPEHFMSVWEVDTPLTERED